MTELIGTASGAVVVVAVDAVIPARSAGRSNRTGATIPAVW
jgi:hypothetical protein